MYFSFLSFLSLIRRLQECEWARAPMKFAKTTFRSKNSINI